MCKDGSNRWFHIFTSILFYPHLVIKALPINPLTISLFLLQTLFGLPIHLDSTQGTRTDAHPDLHRVKRKC